MKKHKFTEKELRFIKHRLEDFIEFSQKEINEDIESGEYNSDDLDLRGYENWKCRGLCDKIDLMLTLF